MSREFGENVRKLLRQRVMTQDDLAQELGVSSQAVKIALNNPCVREMPSKVRRYAQALDVRPEDLVRPIDSDDTDHLTKNISQFFDVEARATNTEDRPSFTETWFAVAEVIARRATCPRLQVGAVIVGVDEKIKGTGYNGAASGMPHCSEDGCLIEPETGRCKRTVHAEINAILGTTPEERAGGTMYVTHEPCESCTAVVLNSGLKAVYFREAYPHREPMRAELLTMIRQGNVDFRQVGRGDDR